MKKFFLLIFTGILLLALVSCSGAGTAGGKTESSGLNSAASAGKAAPGVAFREGSESSGKMILSSGDIAGISVEKAKSDHSSYQIVFQLTEKGKKSFAEETEKLAQSAGKASIWLGSKRIITLSVYAPITDGAVAIEKKDQKSAEALCRELESQPK